MEETFIGLNNEPLSKRERREARFKKILETDPELRVRLVDVLHKLSEKQKPMPLLHITSASVVTSNGERIDTGFIKNIRSNGFRDRDTNVSAFVNREDNARIGTPEYFAKNPQSLLRDISMKIERYKHHGIRINKNALKEQTTTVEKGVPVALLIDATNAELDKATDYDDHYILREPLPGDTILGEIDLEVKNFNDDLDLKDFADKFVTSIDNISG